MISQSLPLALAAAFALGGTIASAQSAEDELRAAEDRWEVLWNAEDAAGLAALYAEDGMRLPPDASRVVGPEAIEAMFRDEFAAGLDNLQLEATEIGSDGTLGWVVGNTTIEFPVEGGMMTGTGNYVIVYRREDDGAWRIVIDTWNDAP
jgi:uncharacterized protein (TIGR02246 family)